MQKIWCGLALLIAIALVPSLYLNRFLSWWCLEKWDSLRQSQVTTYGIYPNFNIWFSCSSPMTKFTILMLGSDLWYQLLNCLNTVNALDYDYPTKAHPSDAQQLLHLQNATSAQKQDSLHPQHTRPYRYPVLCLPRDCCTANVSLANRLQSDSGETRYGAQRSWGRSCETQKVFRDP